MIHYGRGLLEYLNLGHWKTFFPILQGLLFLQTFDVFQLLGQIWGFLSNVSIFRFGQDRFVRLIWLIGRPISRYCRGCSNALIIFLEFETFFFRFLMFSGCWGSWVMVVFCFWWGLFHIDFLGQSWGFLINVDMFHLGWYILV